MRFRNLLFVVIGLCVIAGIAIVTLALWPTSTRPIQSVATIDPKVIEAGRYVAVAGDCTACHTAPGGQPFAGGLPVASPIGNIYSTNITPDPETGIGNYSLNDFDRAIRHGITPRGGSLYPAMPYPSYAKLSDADVAALYAYFMQGVEPVRAVNHPTDIRWPLSMRWPLGLWRKAFGPKASDSQFATSRYTDPAVARGAYLTQAAGHCGTCHTPRAITLQEKGLDESSPFYLAGGPVIDGWAAVNLRGNLADGLGAWSADEIAALLRTGRNTAHAVIGAPMRDVVSHSTQNLTDDDVKAIAAYLKTLKPSETSSASFKANDKTAQDLLAGRDDGRGAELYVDNCAACHRTNGQGVARTFPAIAGNSTVLSSEPTSLMRLILLGSALPATSTAPSNLGMPGFAERLSDDEVAQLVTFIRKSWGNDAPAAKASDVKAIRQDIPLESK